MRIIAAIHVFDTVLMVIDNILHFFQFRQFVVQDLVYELDFLCQFRLCIFQTLQSHVFAENFVGYSSQCNN